MGNAPKENIPWNTNGEKRKKFKNGKREKRGKERSKEKTNIVSE